MENKLDLKNACLTHKCAPSQIHRHKRRQSNAHIYNELYVTRIPEVVITWKLAISLTSPL